MSVKLYIENSEEKGKSQGNIFFEGTTPELILAIVGAMQAEPYLESIFKRAVFALDLAKKKGWDITTHKELALDDEAEKRLKNLIEKGEHGKT